MSVVVKNLGKVTAYAYAVSKGYSGTEAEFAEAMANIGNISAEAETLEPNAEATASYEDGVISFGIPRGEKGDKGNHALTANSSADMTNQTAIYVYTGSETGYTFGHWYYYDGSDWFDGGVYTNSDTDTTLSVAGMAADAKATGDAIDELKEDFYITKNSNINSWAQGTLSSSTGGESSSNTRCRSSFIHFESKQVKISVKQGYKIGGRIYTEKSTSGYVEGIAFTSDDFYLYDTEKFYRFIIATTNDGSIAPSNLPNDVVTVEEEYTTDTTLALSGKAADAKATGDIIDEITSFVEFYPNTSLFYGSIRESDGKFTNNNNCRIVYFPCEPNRTYKITKTAGTRFDVGCSIEKPAHDVFLTKYYVDNTASEIIFKTDSTAVWLAAFVYYSSTDTGTAANMLNSLHYYILSANVVYEKENYSLMIGQRAIYDTKNYVFKVLSTSITSGATQSIVYKNGNQYIFTSNPIQVIEITDTGTKTIKTVTEFGHVMSVELLSDGTFLVASADENYGTAAEKRKVYFYDFDTNTITDSFTPTISGNLVFASQIDTDNYYLIDWQGQSNNLHFYTYVRSTDTATEIGTVTAERSYLQGGCRIGDVLYLSVNDGWSSQTDALIEVINKNTLESLNTIVMEGFVEVEGFHVVNDNLGNLHAYFCDGKAYSSYCMKLR